MNDDDLIRRKVIFELICNQYVNFENIKYPYVQVMADNFVKKAYELVGLGF